MQFNYPAGRTEPWLARFVQFRKSRDGATATGPGDRGDRRASVDSKVKVTLRGEPPELPSYSLYWLGPTLVLSFPISVSWLVLVGEEN